MYVIRPVLLVFVLLLVFASLQVSAQTTPSKPCTPTIVGTVETFDLHSAVFDNTRTVRVFLPEGYREAANRDRHYPVLYMFDGQNLFDACLASDHVHEWQVDETVTRLVGENKIEPLIVVGLDNARAMRSFEYLAWPDDIQDPGGPAPGGARLPEFLIKEVMPEIEKRYRIEHGRENTGIGGSSYGGIAAIYLGVTAPTIFGKVLAESPVFWVGNGKIVRETSFLAMAPLKVFMAYGGKEWEMPGANGAQVEMIHRVEANLKNALVSPSEVKFLYDPEAEHNEQAWSKRLPEALTFLFPAGK
ncbi:MAG: alpha/beta hydrolase-fold protein [Terriglobales bacterium]|jgi:predicted alpha/beta superfamily hydrolase